MIKLGDVKVRPQYRTRVRYRLLALEYAWQHGPAAAGRHYGLRARTIRRWRKRWRQGGVEGLVPSYPRHRARRVPPAAIELIRQARQEFGYGAARARLWLQRVHGIRLAMGTIRRVFETCAPERVLRFVPFRRRVRHQCHHARHGVHVPIPRTLPSSGRDDGLALGNGGPGWIPHRTGAGWTRIVSASWIRNIFG